MTTNWKEGYLPLFSLKPCCSFSSDAIDDDAGGEIEWWPAEVRDDVRGFFDDDGGSGGDDDAFDSLVSSKEAPEWGWSQFVGKA